MNKKDIQLGNTLLKIKNTEVKGEFVEIENEKFYKISNSNLMDDFFMTIVSDSNHWMFISSNGSLTAGRKNRNNALFPYYTVDKIHDYKDKTGSKTICLIEKNNQTYLWEPFTDESEKIYNIERNLYKSIYGNKIIFEERNKNLEIDFRYGWYNSEKLGWIKKSEIYNNGNYSVTIDILDGIRNILPSGVDYLFQNEYSNLSDAYKKNELLKDSKLGLFMLSSIPVDRAEPSEALKATSVWSYTKGEETKYLISDKQLNHFKYGQDIETEYDIRASRGAYYINERFQLEPFDRKEWYFAIELNQDSANIADLDLYLKENKNIATVIKQDIRKGTDNLIKIVASSDGLQLSNEELSSARHFSNTLFNIMRGGIYTDNYNIDKNDLILYVNQCNKPLYEKFANKLKALPTEIQYPELINWSFKLNNPDLERICYEYLPLTFSRRHGDPSRPWNQFSIETKNEDESNKLSYEGNWRDIFQNWEALSLSFPEYIEGIISKFLNASTPDGYNPYRITRQGIDWETPDPNDPWAYIGYWGDHQIIYLQKLLEQSDAFHPGKLNKLITKELFVYANVPYRIKNFDDIVKNPQDTIIFDFELDKKLKKLSIEIGADGKLLRNSNGEIYKTNLLEKILVTLLTKLSNFIPEAGIWLNTQRPEWNDANNALVGNGVSMVTLYYLYRFLKFWKIKVSEWQISNIKISEEVATLLSKTQTLFDKNQHNLLTGFSDKKRYDITSQLGKFGSEYRKNIYKYGFSGKKTIISSDNLSNFIELSLQYLEQSIKKNQRNDKLYHAYNLISINNNSMSIRYLDEMLEGQVAVLSSGYLTAKESLEVMDALKNSKLFREDQYSYVLYPDKQRPRFTEKNNIPKEKLQKSVLLQKLIQNNNQDIIKTDKTGNYHFNSAFRNVDILKNQLNKLSNNEYKKLIDTEKDIICEIYEEIFDHQSFTGRSGTFYGYEGLGSIYWHMVSKLLLAVQENYFLAIEEKTNNEILGRIKEHYYEIKAGIGIYKSPKLYGAFPTDAYSHTPQNAGAKQPGLTGQVKEDIISRFGELGIKINNGEICFNTSLLNHNEILDSDKEFNYYGIDGKQSKIRLKISQIAFTFCQIPIIYNFKNSTEKIIIKYLNGNIKEIETNKIKKELSYKIFSKTKEIESIEYYTL